MTCVDNVITINSHILDIKHVSVQGVVHFKSLVCYTDPRQEELLDLCSIQVCNLPQLKCDEYDSLVDGTVI